MIDRQAPWQGHLQAHVPDLAWLSPLLGEGWQLAGQLNGAMRLDGSAGRPEFSGEWRGVHGKPRRQMYLAIAILIFAAVVLAYGNTLAAK